MLKKILILIVVLLSYGCAGRHNALQDYRMECMVRRSQYLDAHPQLNAITRDAIWKGVVFPTMTKEEVIASWGGPKYVNKTVGINGALEQWVYGTSEYIGRPQLLFTPTKFLYFEDGELTAMSSSER